MLKKSLIPLTVLGFSMSTLADENMLLPIVVSGSMTEQIITEAPASMSVVTQEEMKKRPVHNVVDVLKYAEGVTVSSSNNQGISLRGLNPSYTLILIDGKRVSSRQLSVRHNDDSDLSWVSPNDIERIEVIRGPMASLYGADAIGGVVNIITKKVKDYWRGNVELSLTNPEEAKESSNNEINVSANGPLIGKKLKAKLNARRSVRERAKFGVDDARQYSGQEKILTNNQLIYQLDDHNEFRLNAELSKEEQESPSTNGGYTEIDTVRTNFGLEYEGRFDDLSVIARAGQEDYEYENAGNPSDLKVFLSDAQFKFPAFNYKHFFVAGFEYQNYDLNFVAEAKDGTTSKEQTDLNQVAIFLEDAIELTQKSTLTMGVRNTLHSEFNNYVTPRIYLNHQATDELMLKTGIGTGYKAPSILNLSKDFKLPSCKGSCTVLGNPDLGPEKSVSYELGASYTKDELNINVSLFYSELRDMINSYFVDVGTERYRLYRNIDEARTKGVEFGLQYRFTPSLRGKVNYTFTDSHNSATKQRIEGIPQDAANLLIDYDLNDRHSFYGASNYTGQTMRVVNNESIETNPYVIINMGYNYRFKYSVIKDGTFTFGVENVGNHLLDNRYGYGVMGRRYFSKLAFSF